MMNLEKWSYEELQILVERYPMSAHSRIKLIENELTKSEGIKMNKLDVTKILVEFMRIENNDIIIEVPKDIDAEVVFDKLLMGDL